MKKIFLILSLIFIFSVNIFARNINNYNNSQIIKISATWRNNEFINISSNTNDIDMEKKIIYYFTPSFRQMFYNKEEKLEIYLDKVKVLANANVYNKKDIKELELLFNFKDNTGTFKFYDENANLRIIMPIENISSSNFTTDNIEAFDENGTQIDMNSLRDLVEIDGLWKNNNLSGTVKGILYKEDNLFFQLFSTPLEESEFYKKHKKQLEELYDNQNIIFKEILDGKNQTLNTKVYNKNNVLLTEEILYKKNNSFFKTLKQFYTNGNIKEIFNFKDGVYDGLHEIYNEDGSKQLLENYSNGKLISQEKFDDEGFFRKTFTTLKNIAYKIKNFFTFIAEFSTIIIFLALPIIGIIALIYEMIFKRNKK